MAKPIKPIPPLSGKDAERFLKQMLKVEQQMKKSYCERFDVYFDKKTGKYLEGKCRSRNCEFCSKRPKEILKFCPKCKFKHPCGIECRKI